MAELHCSELALLSEESAAILRFLTFVCHIFFNSFAVVGYG